MDQFADRPPRCFECGNLVYPNVAGVLPEASFHCPRCGTRLVNSPLVLQGPHELLQVLADHGNLWAKGILRAWDEDSDLMDGLAEEVKLYLQEKGVSFSSAILLDYLKIPKEALEKLPDEVKVALAKFAPESR